jgi:hypothetical protein
MSARRQELQALLERHYRDAGWKVERHDDGTVRACGIGGVTWIGLAVVAEDVKDNTFAARVLELSDQRMPKGELCPLELLPEPECADEVWRVLERLRLAERGHVDVYSVAA